MNLEQLAGWLISSEKRIELVLETLGKEISWRAIRRAKAKLGKYQPSVGEFPAWAGLSAVTIDEKLRLGLPSPSPLKRGIGWRAGGPLGESIEAEYEIDGETLVVDLQSDDKRMLWHEIGFDNSRTGRAVPPRPVLGPAMYEVVQKAKPQIAQAFVLALTPGYSPPMAQEFGFSITAGKIRRRGRR